MFLRAEKDLDKEEARESKRRVKYFLQNYN